MRHRPTSPNPSTPTPQVLRRVRLQYYADDRPGIQRLSVGRRLTYLDARGKELTDPRQLDRIERLVIPPAWTDVWICPRANGHLQATGRDAKGRKQYLYHVRWQELSNRTKFKRLRHFGESLPALRRRITRELKQPGLPHSKVVAAVIALLDRTMIRVGNEEYARANGSYGLTTLRNRHVQVRGSQLRFRFQGKSGKAHEIDLEDRRLAKIVRRCQELPGQELFQYLDDEGKPRSIGSDDINTFLRATMGKSFTAKDFRTWKATALVFSALRSQDEMPASPTAGKRVVNQAIRDVARLLGNTVTVCRSYYVHPEITSRFLDGKLELGCAKNGNSRGAGLNACERQLLRILRGLERPAGRP